MAEGKPIPVGDGITIKPIIDARLRYELVDQDNALDEADALTMRVRSGAEIGTPFVSVLAEAESVLGIVNDYNSSTNGKTGYSVVADPQNIELNRLQATLTPIEQLKVTVGRQRINLDDQRWVGSVGWRQSEQTFDAVRVEAANLGPVVLDLTYSNSERTVFGVDAGTRTKFKGDFWLANGGFKLGPVSAKAFAYLLDQDEAGRLLFASQTYGLRAAGSIPLGDNFAVSVEASYAKQKDWKGNPVDYQADYYAGALGTTFAGFGVTAGYEELGSDGGGYAVQTPFATLHKFNGWADIFLTTPNAGLRDYYATIGKKLPGVTMLPGLNASVTYHKFDSDSGSLDYGDEWDALVGFKVRGIGVALKYANYNADQFAVDTQKFWAQLEWSF